jgi:hypothetical protein
VSAFSQVEKRVPPGNVVVPPSAFADTWEDRPKDDVCMGLRLIPDVDLEDARIEAFKRAENLFPNYRGNEEQTQLFVASFQDTLLRWVIARGTCDPNDVTKAWSGWAAAPEDIAVEQALTDHGAQRIFDEWERMRITANVVIPEASDADLALLPELLKRLPILAAESRTRAIRLRRLLRFVLEELEEVEVPAETPAEPA